MENKKDDLKIAKLVFKNLVWVLKKHKQYFVFRCFIGYNYSIAPRSIYHCNCCFQKSHFYMAKALGKDNPFAFCKNQKDVYLTMVKLPCNGLKNKEFNNLEGNKNKQIYIMSLVNNLLHFCLEGAIGLRDIRKVEAIGKEAFEMTCKMVFGDDFVDEIEPQEAITSIDDFVEIMKGNGYHPSQMIPEALRIVQNSCYGSFSPNMLTDWCATIANTNIMDEEEEPPVYGTGNY